MYWGVGVSSANDIRSLEAMFKLVLCWLWTCRVGKGVEVEVTCDGG